MKQRKIYYSRKAGKIVCEGKRNNKTIYLFTIPYPEKLLESSLFAKEKVLKIMEKISRLDFKKNKGEKEGEKFA